MSFRVKDPGPPCDGEREKEVKASKPAPHRRCQHGLAGVRDPSVEMGMTKSPVNLADWPRGRCPQAQDIPAKRARPD